MITLQTDTLTLSSDNKSLTEMVMATIQLTGGATGTCTLAGTYTQNKVSS